MPAKLKLLQNEDMAKEIDQLHTLQLRGYCSRNGYLRLQQVLAMARTLYNAALQERRDAYRHSRNKITYNHQQNQITLIKKDLPEYKEVDLRIWRATLWKLDKSFKAFFRRAVSGKTPGYPRFKGRNRYRTIELAAVPPGNAESQPRRPEGLGIHQRTTTHRSTANTAVARQGIPPNNQDYHATHRSHRRPGLPP